MERLDNVRSGAEAPREPVGLDRLLLRFRDRDLESSFRADFFRHNVANLRFALIGGVVLWIGWGLFLDRHLLSFADQALDRHMRYGVFIPLLVVSFVLSYTPFFHRIWEWVALGVTCATLLSWVYYVAHIVTLPAEYGYVGVILITAFTYTLLRLRFVLVMTITLVGIATYLPYSFSARYMVDVSRVLATLYLVTFGALGGVAAYRMELFTRRLFVRERQLDRERERSDGLLLNILPQAIVDRLKVAPHGERIAQAFDEVSVVFADAVGSTEQASRCSAEEFADTLDHLFRRFDQIADRHGLEKIKTVGDAYMAVAGAPVPTPNHAAAAVAMAEDIVAEAREIRWPSGDPVEIRTGVASGPAVAGVIGQRKFAYDLWGDTVNLASRLQEIGEPGRVLVSEATAERLGDRYEFLDPIVLNLKGKGPTPARFLVGRRTLEPAATNVRG
jgi:class 3 adenylate cyclase